MNIDILDIFTPCPPFPFSAGGVVLAPPTMPIDDIFAMQPGFDSPSAGRAWFMLFLLDEDGEFVRRLAAVPGEDRSLSVTDLLGDGEWHVALVYQDEYGNQSPFTVSNTSSGLAARGAIDIRIGTGNVFRELITPQIDRATQLAGGSIELAWRSVDLSGHQDQPAEWEIATLADPNTILLTVPARRGYTVRTVGPFAEGDPVVVALRASDGAVDGRRGPWVYAPAITIDLTAPAVPALVPP